MARLQLALLGTPTVQHKGRSVKFASRKALALLVYLAVEGRLVARERLMALFWPESNRTRARTALRTTLTYLRDALREQGDTHLLVAQDALGLKFDGEVEVDCRVLEAAAMAAAHQPSLHPRQLMAQCQQASAQYRGDFLAGFSLSDAPEFDDWLSVQREHWHQRLSLILERLSQWQFDGGEIARSIETARRWVSHDPFNEAAHRRLMQSYLASGERAATLQAYETCCAILARELNAEPSAETEAIAQRIRQPSSLAYEVQPLAATRPLIGDAPLVGRAREHMALASEYRLARKGSLRLALVEGEPGIGKTRLLHEFAHWAAGQGTMVLHARAFETGGRLPYQLIVNALRARLAHEPEVRTRLDEVWLAELARLLPEVGVGLRPAASNDHEHEARLRLYESIARFTLALAAHAPLLVLMDDVQWADAASLDVLHYLCRRWMESGSPVLLVLSARAEDVHDVQASEAVALRDWLASFARDIPLTRITLGPLAMDDTQQLVRALAPAPVDDALVQHLSAETAGHPLFVVETLKALLEQSDVSQPETLAQAHRAQRGALPPSIRALIRARLARLPALTQSLLNAAAVLDPPLDFEGVRQVSDMSEGDALNALDVLLRRGLLRESRDAPTGRLDFAHEQIRHVAYAEVSEARRRVLHRRAAEMVEQRFAANVSEHAPRIAHHYDQAGDARALQFYLLAGDAAARVYANAEAVAHYTRALDIAQRNGERSVLQDLYLRRGRALELSARYDEALANYAELETQAGTQDNRAMQLAALMARATLYATPTPRYNASEARRLCDQALGLARALGERATEAKILWNLLHLARTLNDYAGALGYGEQSLALARTLDLTEQTAYTLNDLGLTYLLVGEFMRAQAANREARELWRALRNLPMLADNLSSATVQHLLLGEFAEAISASQEAYALSARADNLWGQAYSLTYVAQAHVERGEMDKAIGVMQEAIGLGEQAGFMVPQIQTRADLALLLGDLGAAKQGLGLAREALRLAEQQFPPARLHVVGVLTHLHLALGEVAEAERVLQLAGPAPDARGLPQARLTFLIAQCELALAQCDGVRALATCDNLLSVQRALGIRQHLPISLYLKGEALRVQGLLAEAHAVLNEARTIAEAVGACWRLWPILLSLSEMERQRGDVAEAQGLLTRARETVDGIAARITDYTLRESFLGSPHVQMVHRI